MAWRNFLTGATTHSWSVTGTASDGKAYTITLSTAALPAEPFPLTGSTYSVGETTAVFGIDQLGLQTSKSRSYYNPATFAVVGTQTTLNADPPTCSIVSSSPTVPPTSTAVGTTGPLQTFIDRNGCTQSSSTTGSSVTTWSVQADGAVTFFCLNTTASDNSPTPVVQSTESECVEVAADGTLGTRARISLSEGSVSLIAKNY